ncbi:hypothetical protein FFWV33_17640 [Flavobacterium faecale]|uniref:Nephrocystin 3-like N-terminal domain-containing protein n=1 Tax=Flavobacterium faecale TaxID=1355330 RepID=A0A2S1LHN3_9FLAO|nr:hypothetical protein [Flavobacterium faecale]AWG23218.1 hypothetical protein FFWV33_17640 [Flavobacterium faecale]
MSEEAKIIRTYDYSIGFNSNIIPSINRKHYVRELEELLEENQVVFLNGEEGSGKTIICQEFVKKNDTIALSVFFNPNNKLDYTLNYFLDNIINQISFLLGDIENTEVNIDRYRALINKLRNKYKNKRIYFIIDGLSENINLMKEIVEYLNLGQAEFKYIIIGDEKLYKKEIKDFSRLITTNIKVVGISIYEIKHYLNLTNLTSNDENDLYKITKGLFSRLFVIKRQLEKGVLLSKIMESEDYSEWIQIELDKIDLTNESIIKILSILSLSPNRLCLEDISFIMDIELEEISVLINSLEFIIIKENEIAFISNSYKKYVADKFKKNIDSVENSLIILFNKTNDLDKKIELIKLLFEKKKWTDISNEVNDDLLINSFKHTGSLNKINSIIKIGNNASNQLKSQNNLVHLSLKGSYINYLENNLELVSDVVTKLAFKDYEGALNIANKSFINIERLRLYCLIAKKQKKDNNVIDENLLSDIEELFEKSDFSNAGDIIYDIISDMLIIDPAMALKIVDNSELNSSTNINDMIVAKLSIMSLNNEIDNDKKESTNEKLEKFANSKSRKIARALSLILGDFSIDKILTEIEKIEDSIEKIKLIRLYLENIKKSTEGLGQLIDRTFDILLSTNVNNLINLEILILLSSKINLVVSLEEKESLLKKLSSIDQLIVDKGLFINKIKYKINIFSIKFSKSPDRSFEILDEIIQDIEKEDDLLIKTEAFSLVYESLHKNSNYILKSLKSKNYNLLNKSIDLLIYSSANQYSIFRNIIKNISSVDIKFAVEISSKINNTLNRDKSLLSALENYFYNVDLKDINIDNIIIYLDSFQEIYLRNLAISIIFEKFSEEDVLNNYFLKKIKEIYFSIEKVINSTTSLIFLNILMFKIFKKNAELKNNKDLINIKSKIKTLISYLSDDWTKYEVVNNICSELTEYDLNFSKDIYSIIKNKKDKDIFYSELYCKSFHYNMEYLIFSLESLIEKKINVDVYVEQTILTINKIPSDLVKLDYFSKLGFIFYLHNQSNHSKQLLEKNIYPLLTNEKISLEDSNIIIFLYINNEDYAKKIISKFSYHYRNETFYKIALFYLDNNNPYKLYEDKVTISNFSYNDLSKCISAFKNVDRDLEIFRVIEKIADKISHKEANLNTTQISYIVDELDTIIETKLPDSINIQHEGYKIISKVQLNRINKNYLNSKDALIECSKVANISDRIFIKSIILRDLTKTPIERKQLFDDIINDLEEINITFEYIERINEISETMYSVNNSAWSKVVKSALTFSNNLDDKYEIYKYQRNLIDTIHKIDEKLCNELIESVDCLDKIDNKDIIKKHLSRLELLKKVKNNQTIEEKEKENQNNLLYAIYNSLMLLNSGKISPKKIIDINKILDISYSIPIDKSIIIYLYYLENISKKKYPKAEELKIKDLLLENLKCTFDNFEFLKRLHVQNFKEKTEITFELINSNNLSIEIGEREKGKNYIKDWILNEAKNNIIIIDSYFSYDDLELIKLITSINNDTELIVLGNKLTDKNTILEKWKIISSEDFPISEFIFASKQDKTSPFHDRYIFSLENKKALRLGTSYNQMGIRKATEISKLEGSEYQHIYNTIVQNFIIDKNRTINKERINYDTFQF